MKPQDLVKVEHLEVILDHRVVLTDIHLTVQRGEIVSLIGPNGAGKSTLVRTILGFIKPTSGTIEISPQIRIGYMPQKFSLMPYLPLTVERFLSLANKINPEYKNKKNLKTLLEDLKIPHLIHSPMQTISGGELQRVLLARALLQNPDLLILDEPTQGVDVPGQQELYALLMRIRDTHQCGILLVSHDLYLVMAGTDRVICLNKHICCYGHREEVRQHPEFLKMFGVMDLSNVGLYTHRHDHHHGLGGDVCP